MSTLPTDIHTDLGTLTVTKHTASEMENYNSSCVYFLPWGVFQYITDGEMKPWGKTELEKSHNSIWIICWNYTNTVAILYMCYFRTLGH